MANSSQSNIQRDTSQKINDSASGVFSYSSKSPSTSSTSLQQNVQQQRQPTISPSQRGFRTESATDQQRDLYTQRNSQLISDQPQNRRSSSLQREPVNPQYKPRQQPLSPTDMIEANSPPHQQQPQIDPLELNALKDTNEALKTEVQRLSLFELKSKSLEKEVILIINYSSEIY